jgi:acyl transferase domain-containing protein
MTNGAGKGSQIALISANCQESAREYAERICDFIKANPSDIDNMAYTLAFHREQLPFRAYLITDEESNVEISAAIKCPSEAPKIVMVFSGQGAQWPQMGRELILSDPLFREDIEEMDRILRSLRFPPSWSLKGKEPISLFKRPELKGC